VSQLKKRIASKQISKQFTIQSVPAKLDQAFSESGRCNSSNALTFKTWGHRKAYVSFGLNILSKGWSNTPRSYRTPRSVTMGAEPRSDHVDCDLHPRDRALMARRNRRESQAPGWGITGNRGLRHTSVARRWRIWWATS